MARLQAALTLATIALAAVAGWAWWSGRGGAWPALVLLGCLFTHAIVLLAEVALMQRANHRAGLGGDGLAATLKSWFAEVLAAPRVFCWEQPFFRARWPDRLEGSGRGVLLVHGYLCNRGLWNPWLARLHRLSVPVMAVDLDPPWRALESHQASIEDAVARLEAATGQAPIVVAHSMGGLVVRHWLASDAAHPARVHHLVTLATPHHGTWIARFGLGAGTRQMRLKNPWISGLVQREAAAAAVPTTCFYSHSDNIVFPADSGTLPGADNRRLQGIAHVHMLHHPAPWQRLMALLGQPGG